MGILDSGLLGPVRKKTGPAIGRVHNGQNVISALYRKSTKPRTQGQLDSQIKLGLLNGYLSMIDVLVKPGFAAYTKKNRSPVNAAFSYNYDYAFLQEGDQWLLDYPKIVYSRGDILAPDVAEVEHVEGMIRFSWLPQRQSTYCQFTDLASFLFIDPSDEHGLILQYQVTRNTLKFETAVHESEIGRTFHCFMNLCSADGKKQGDSMYVGEVKV